MFFDPNLEWSHSICMDSIALKGCLLYVVHNFNLQEKTTSTVDKDNKSV